MFGLIYDCNNSMVKKFSNETTLEISLLKAGVYILSINTGQQIVNRKILKL